MRFNIVNPFGYYVSSSNIGLGPVAFTPSQAFVFRRDQIGTTKLVTQNLTANTGAVVGKRFETASYYLEFLLYNTSPTGATYFYTNSVFDIGTDGTNGFNIRLNGGNKWGFHGSTYAFRPLANAAYDFGTASLAINNSYLAVAATITSDARLKEQVSPLSDVMLKAWADINWVTFKMRDSVEAKGDKARTHVGLIAQDVVEVLERHGLNPYQLASICYDEWDAEYEHKRNDDGSFAYYKNGKPVMVKVREAGDKYSLRYEQAFAIEVAYLRHKLAKLEALVETLLAKGS
jgi:hypothetical protein